MFLQNLLNYKIKLFYKTKWNYFRNSKLPRFLKEIKLKLKNDLAFQDGICQFTWTIWYTGYTSTVKKYEQKYQTPRLIQTEVLKIWQNQLRQKDITKL